MITFDIDIKTIILALVAIVSLVYSIYNKIKFACLQKAAELVASVEKNEEMSGAEKFATVVLWINETLPKIFQNELIKATLEKLVQYIYENMFRYAQSYIKRKTGYNISQISEELRDSKEVGIEEILEDNAKEP